MRTSCSRAAAFAALCLVACADLEPMALGVCGNAVLESGEDCDLHAEGELSCGLPDSGVTACRFVCGPGAACPASWACGEDHLCRYATGRFTEAAGSPSALVGSLVALADFDGDGVQDALSAGRDEISVRHGDGVGSFGRAVRYPTRLSGPPTADDLDGDGRADIVVPTAGGLVVLRGRSDRALSPVPFSPFALDELEGDVGIYSLPVFPALHYATLVLLADVNGGGVVSMNSQRVLPFPLGLGVGDLAGPPAMADLDPPAPDDAPFDGTWELALAFRDRDEVIVVAAQLAQLADGTIETRPVTRATVRLPSPATRGAALADVDGDGRVDLLVPVRSEVNGEDVAVALQNADGTFRAAQLDPRFDRTQSCTIGDAPGGGGRELLVTADFGGGPGADVVLPGGLFLDVGEQLCALVAISPLEPFVAAATGDFNRDGHADLVFATEASRLFVLYGDGGWSVTSSVVPIEAPALLLRAGDFDGDGVDDVAYVQRRPGEGDVLAVIYGEAAGPLQDSIEMGSFPWIEQLELARGIDTDRTDDLLVMARARADGSGSRSVGVLRGAPERALVSTFPLVTNTAAEAEPVDPELEEPRAVLIGHFDPSLDALPDLVAVSEARLWLLPGAGGARFEAAALREFAPTELASFDAGAARFASADLDADGQDELVGVDGSGRRLTEPPRLLIVKFSGDEAAPPLATLTTIDTDRRGLADLRLLDVDSDGDLDLVAVFSGANFDGEAATSGLVIVSNDRGTLGATRTIAAADHAVLSVDRANADGEPELELVVLGTEAAHVLEPGANGLPPPALTVPAAFGRLVTGDVDEDGLDDLVLSSGDNLRVFLARPHVER